jgi:hypothetical protein
MLKNDAKSRLRLIFALSTQYQKQKKQVKNLLLKWWSRRESNSGPEKITPYFLHAYLIFIVGSSKAINSLSYSLVTCLSRA